MDSANAALPQVRILLEDAREAMAQVRDAQANLRDLHIVHGDAMREAGHPASQEHEALARRLVEARERIAACVGLLEGMHVELKDIDQGLVDFRGLVGTKQAYLCWRLGEEAVAHWHEMDGGFAGRKPIPRL